MGDVTEQNTETWAQVVDTTEHVINMLNVLTVFLDRQREQLPAADSDDDAVRLLRELGLDVLKVNTRAYAIKHEASRRIC
ncbi:hypothetical protein GCM10007377_15270 [Galliscardovia ingluviei]|uniref:Uncharacterized protein n=1 Tax=Galliscardovia ingluviei TaxID=1769422 RepID=A0A8J3AIT7_9BIFI|nr:hypothetical protein [Galliscardovia ingluviei]GGI15312.1 hypothetical protein GCM10007377_15270 [Galliscardovia ingluviei]